MNETWVTPTTTTWTTKAMVLEVASPEALRMIFGTLGPQQRSARIDYQRTVPDLPPAPRRRRGLTGRRYRTVAAPMAERFVGGRRRGARPEPPRTGSTCRR